MIRDTAPAPSDILGMGQHIYKVNSTGPSTEPCRTPQDKGKCDMNHPMAAEKKSLKMKDNLEFGL